MKVHTIEIETQPYQSSKLHRPWVAVIQFNKNGKPNYINGKWEGSSGCAGILKIEAKPGDIVANGQQRYYGKGSDPNFYLVDEDGSLLRLRGGIGEAQEVWLGVQGLDTTVSDWKRFFRP